MAMLGLIILIIISLCTLLFVTFGSWGVYEEFTANGEIRLLMQHITYSSFLILSCILFFIIKIPKLHIIWVLGFGILIIFFSIKLINSILKKRNFKNMSGQDIKNKRIELSKQKDDIWAEWRAYDKKHPVVAGEYKPADYDYMQKDYLNKHMVATKKFLELPDSHRENLLSILFIILGITGILLFNWFLF